MKAILATDINGGIGKNGRLPEWNIPGDLKRFRKLTENRVVVMGSNTFFSLPTRPLSNRINIILTRNIHDKKFQPYIHDKNIRIMDLSTLLSFSNIHEFICIGGADVMVSLQSYIHDIDLTIVHKDYQCDTLLLPMFHELLNTWTIHNYNIHETFTRMRLSKPIFSYE